MSLQAGFLVLFVLAFRLVFQRVPKRYRLLLWGLVVLRLLVPFRIESAFSLLPAPPVAEMNALPALRVIATSPAAPIFSTVDVAPEAAQPSFSLAALLGALWLAGVAAMALYSIVSYARLDRKVRSAVCLRENIWQTGAIQTPFVLGFFKPRIYLPKELPIAAAHHVIAHEQAHIRHFDQLLKPLGFVALALHWFNPLVWLGYFFFCRDIELACDERVIRDFPAAQRADYSQALLTCSVRGAWTAACPIAFGEVGVKERVKSILSYKKPAFWIILLAVAACVVAVVCLMTEPATPAADDPSVSGQALTQMQGVLAQRDDIAVSLPATQAPVTAASTPEPTSAATPTPQPVPLTPESAKAFIDATLSTFTLYQDGTVSFTIPDAMPVSEDGKTGLSINLNATFRESPGVFSVQRVLDQATDWQSGQTFVGQLEAERGELIELMLRVAFMTQTGESAYKQYAANYVELSAPFVYDAPTVYVDSAVQVEDGALLYTLQNGTQVRLTVALPDGAAMTPISHSAGETTAVPSTVCITNGGDAIYGTINLYPLGTTDMQTLSQVDPAQNELPMPIFASVALANHAGYEDYTVQKSHTSGAVATAKFIWQDVTSATAAAAAPWEEADCVLAYDHALMPFFVEILLAPNAFPAQDLAALAQSISLSQP